MNISVEPFRPDQSAHWDLFCREAAQGTLLHTRRFLSYHGERFEDRSLLIYSDKKLIGLFPAAKGENNYIVSHPGITYGGILHAGGLSGCRMIEAFQILREYYLSLGATDLVYKAVPHIYQSVPSQDDLYALFRLGAHLLRRDLNCVINLRRRSAQSERRRRSLSKARKSGIIATQDNSRLAELWAVISENLRSRHSAAPVHTLDEMRYLSQEFSLEIKCFVAVLDQVVVAGVIIFETPTAYHAQYIASNADGYKYAALDAVFELAINTAAAQGKCWLAFGTSNEDDGRVLNDGLYKFKSEFGGGGVVHEHYKLKL